MRFLGSNGKVDKTAEYLPKFKKLNHIIKLSRPVNV